MNKHKLSLSSFLLVYFISLPGISLSQNEQALFQEALTLLKDNYYSPEDIKRLLTEKAIKDCREKNQSSIYKAINCLTSKVKDPYTKYLTPEAANKELKRIKTLSTGLGITVDPIDQSLITRIQTNSPADRAGIKENDKIISINKIPIEYLNIEEINQALIHAEVGKKTLLDLQRGYLFFSVEIEMQEIPILSTRSKLLNSGIFYIKIDDLLSKSAADEVENLLLSKEAKNSNSLILDLRSNKGGLLKNGLIIADLFIKSGKLLIMISNEGKRIFTAKPNTLYSNPIVILINGQTASSSEVIATALKDNNIAVLVGTKSFGKGLVQQIKALSNGSALHITVSQLQTSKGRVINKTGITPDIFVRNDSEQLRAAIGYLKTITRDQINSQNF
ncbi:MAG: S41 family peptidase [Candidatus Caenarcaniphilales bacterium]|nr:S41 family peptidase [Candidatus Caenarcaniphilales bacterium]